MLYAGGAGMALIFVWLRLSTMKQLDWHRGSSYQSKDIAHAQKTIAQRMADKVCASARTGSCPNERLPRLRESQIDNAR